MPDLAYVHEHDNKHEQVHGVAQAEEEVRGTDHNITLVKGGAR